MVGVGIGTTFVAFSEWGAPPCACCWLTVLLLRYEKALGHSSSTEVGCPACNRMEEVWLVCVCAWRLVVVRAGAW